MPCARVPRSRNPSLAVMLAFAPAMAAAASAAPFGQPTVIGGFTMPAAHMASPAAECERVFRDGFDPFKGGVLSRPIDNGHPMEYLTHGGYTIKIDRHTITITDHQGMNTVQHWGDPHENLNGKHIKDWGGAAGWSGNRRSIVLGDGTKVTMEAAGWQGVVESTSIYDEYRNVQFNNVGNFVQHYSTDIVDTQLRESAQYDGETALFVTDPASRTASYDNVYNETFDSAGDPVVTPANAPLGTTGGCANPNQVNDLFDDTRQGHT